MVEIGLYDPQAGDVGMGPVGSQHPLPVAIIPDPTGGLTPAPVGAQQQPAYLSLNITTQTTKTAKTGGGILHAIVFNKPLAAGVVAIYDGLSASGTLLGTITFPATLLSDVGTYTYDIVFQEGLTLVTSGATQDITVAYI